MASEACFVVGIDAAVLQLVLGYAQEVGDLRHHDPLDRSQSHEPVKLLGD